MYAAGSAGPSLRLTAPVHLTLRISQLPFLPTAVSDAPEAGGLGRLRCLSPASLHKCYTFPVGRVERLPSPWKKNTHIAARLRSLWDSQAARRPEEKAALQARRSLPTFFRCRKKVGRGSGVKLPTPLQTRRGGRGRGRYLSPGILDTGKASGYIYRSTTSIFVCITGPAEILTK